VLTNGTKLPQIFGDPDVKYVPGGAGCQFIYSSILVQRFPAAGPITGTAQTMGVHRSTDCGHTWGTGPFEVTSATNPHGGVSGGNPVDAADKEFMSVDPETGRVIISWTNFTSPGTIPGDAEISTTYSDDIMTGSPPAWSARSILNAASAIGDGDQGSVPRFAGNGSTEVYVAWSTFPANLTNNIGFAKSSDNGASWSPPIILLTNNFFTMDYVLGNDRVHNLPSLAVDNSAGANSGTIYVVYANNDGHDGADIFFQRSINGGTSFSPPIALNSRPGADRAQWFPFVTVDATTGRVSVIYYDQGIATSGDLTETSWIYSDNGGVTWSKPTPLTGPAGSFFVGLDELKLSGPFHAGYGNDTGQPNLGDYIGATAQGGTLFATWAGTPQKVDFSDGQPTNRFSAVDFYLKKASLARAALSLGTPAFIESGGNGAVDAGELVRYTLPLRNTVTNPSIGTVGYTGVSATLSTATLGVSVDPARATQAYPDIAPGASMTNPAEFVVQLSPAFVPGTRIDLLLAVTTVQGSTTLAFSQNTGTPVATTIFSEDFNSTAPGSLPAGWTPFHNGGNNTVPWVTSNTFCGTATNALFHTNADDGLPGDMSRFERAFSPGIVVPPGAEYVTLEFDICYDTEEDSRFNVLAYDGATLRIADLTPGRSFRANLVEAFAEEFKTGDFFHFPKHTPRGFSTPAYFQDMSIWAGDSAGMKHVSMRLPGMQSSTVDLRWEYTQGFTWTCANLRPGHTCGVLVDNILMKSVVSTYDASCAAAIDGSPCSDGNACTQTSTCQGGVCTGANLVVCAAQDQCHEAGTCDVLTGCSNPAKTNGTPCNDGNACTAGEACAGGSCVGGTSVPAPSEPSGVNVGLATKNDLEWHAAANATSYDLLRGDLAKFPVGSSPVDENCLGNFGGLTTSDAFVPGPNVGVWYLVRGRNVCNVGGNYGTQGVHGAPGAPRVSTTCP
jgi:hypothetical protein